MDDLREDLLRNVRRIPVDLLLEHMGYRKPSDKTKHRLEQVLADPNLGLSSGAFDLRFDSKSFLLALCEAAGIPQEIYKQAIDARQQELLLEERAFKPYIFIDTGFRRADRPGMSILALAACEGKRTMKLPAGSWQLSMEKQLLAAQQLARSFMAETGGDAGVWGPARRFLFFYSVDQAVILDLAGKLAGDSQEKLASDQ